ncbi:MAG: sigma-70 family RNA polymerase sigma factor [Singulisphaera sp.]
MTPAMMTTKCDDGLSIGELLTRFVNSRDERAFHALVHKFGPLVWHVCRQVTRQRQDAEDAFQQTFLVLAQRAGKIERPSSLASWLYKIAYRNSLRRRVTRQMRREQALAFELPASAEQRRPDDAELLHAELAELPLKYRELLVRKYLQEESLEQIATALSLSPAVVKGRLQRGRNELRARLALRGVSGLSFVAILARHTEADVIAMPDCSVGLERAVSGALAVEPASSNVARRLIKHSRKGLMMTGTIEAIAVLAAAGILTLVAPGASGERQTKNASSATTKLVALAKEPATLSYGDGRADGKKSIAGTGEMIRFSSPAERSKLAGIALHGARYGLPQPPQEDARLYILADDGKTVLHTEGIPYSRFERGESKWNELKLQKPVDVPKGFWVVIDFNAAATKGVYVSYDTSTGGEHSRVGLPGQEAKPTAFGGDWMIRAYLAE